MKQQAGGEARDSRTEQDGEGDETKELALLGEIDAAADGIGNAKDGDGGLTDVAGGEAEGFPDGIAEHTVAEDVSQIASGEERQPVTVSAVEEDDRGEGCVGPPDGGNMACTAAGGEPDPGQQGGKRYHEDKFEGESQSAGPELCSIHLRGIGGDLTEGFAARKITCVGRNRIAHPLIAMKLR